MTSIFRTPLDTMGLLLPTAAPALTSQTMSSNNTRLAWVFQAETAAAITSVGFRLTTITNTGSMPTYRLSLQGVDGSGLPTGTIKGSGNSAYVTFVPTVANGFANSTFTWQTLGTAYTPATVGEGLALVLDVSSGTADVNNNISVAYGLNNVVGTLYGLPAYLIDSNATWATGDKGSSLAPLFGYKTASDVFGAPIESVSTVTWSSTTEQALRFTLPSAIGSSFQLLGAQWIGTAPATGHLYRLSLYSGGESSPSLLEQVELDSDWMASVGALRWVTNYFDDVASTLSFGTQYHLGLAVDGGSPTLHYYQFNAAGDMKALPWGDSAFCLASRTITYPPGSGGNAFASSATQLKQRPVLLPIVSDWTAPSGWDGVLVQATSQALLLPWGAVGSS